MHQNRNLMTPTIYDPIYWEAKHLLINLLNIEAPVISIINGPAVRHAEIPLLGVHLAEYPSTKNPLGVKGIGESGTVPAAAAVISGVEDALRDYNVRIDEAPISPFRIFELIRSAKANKAVD